VISALRPGEVQLDRTARLTPREQRLRKRRTTAQKENNSTVQIAPELAVLYHFGRAEAIIGWWRILGIDLALCVYMKRVRSNCRAT
jgi:hypothetical protein